MSARRSQLQKHVLSLYKQMLRASETKEGFGEQVRREFRQHATEIPKTDTIRIEYMLRGGKRKLQMMLDPHVTGMGSFVEDEGDKKK